MIFKANKWSHIVGNKKLKRTCKNLIKRHKSGLAKHRKPRILTIGESRTGKTETIEMYVQSLMCQRSSPETYDPCGTCEPCSQNVRRFGMTGLYSEFWSGGVEFIPVDCGLYTSLDSLIEKLDIREIHPNRTRVYFVDECHRLFRKKLDEALLKTVEQVNAYWFFATAKPDEIDDMFKKRFVEVSTELPSKLELSKWLEERAKEIGLQLKAHELVEICNESNCVPGLAIKRLEEICLFSV